jgi:hypothetical protein
LLDHPTLVGDLFGEYDFLSRRLRAEAKVGYGGATQMTVKREWFDKAREYAEKAGRDIPCVLGKFSGSRATVRYFIAFDFEAWHELLKCIEELSDENIALREKLHETKLSE